MASESRKSTTFTAHWASTRCVCATCRLIATAGFGSRSPGSTACGIEVVSSSSSAEIPKSRRPGSTLDEAANP